MNTETVIHSQAYTHKGHEFSRRQAKDSKRS